MSAAGQYEYFPNLFILYNRKLMNKQLKEIQYDLSLNEINISIPSLTRIEKCSQSVSQKNFNGFLNCYGLTFTQILNDENCSDLISEIQKRFVHRLIYRDQLITKDIFEEFCYKHSDICHSQYQFELMPIKTYFEMDQRNLYEFQKKFIAMQAMVERNMKLETPVVDPQSCALLYYVGALYYLRLKMRSEAMDLLTRAERFLSRENTAEIHALVSMGMLRCFDCWVFPMDAVERALETEQLYQNLACNDRVWDIRYLRAKYLTRAYRFKEAENLYQKLLIDAKVHQEKDKIKRVYSDLIVLNLCRQNYDMAEYYLEKPEILTDPHEKRCIWRPLTVFWSRGAAQAKKKLKEYHDNDLFDQDQKFYVFFKAYLAGSPKLEKELEKFICYCRSVAAYEMENWAYQLMEKRYLEQENFLMAYQIVAKKNNMILGLLNNSLYSS